MSSRAVRSGARRGLCRVESLSFGCQLRIRGRDWVLWKWEVCICLCYMTSDKYLLRNKCRSKWEHAQYKMASCLEVKEKQSRRQWVRPRWSARRRTQLRVLSSFQQPDECDIAVTNRLTFKTEWRVQTDIHHLKRPRSRLMLSTSCAVARIKAVVGKNRHYFALSAVQSSIILQCIVPGDAPPTSSERNWVQSLFRYIILLRLSRNVLVS